MQTLKPGKGWSITVEENGKEWSALEKENANIGKGWSIIHKEMQTLVKMTRDR